MIRLVFTFYFSLLLYNVSISLAGSLITLLASRTSVITQQLNFFGVFGIFLFTGGYLLSVGYFEISKKNQFYFYFNNGLSRVHLYGFAFIINLLAGLTILVISK